jgi:CheY-like chemotaxis protein
MTLPSDPELPQSRARVLLVEDDDELRALIAENLGAAGFEVIEASDGEGFIDRLTETLTAGDSDRAFDVILSDIQMPAFSALDVLVGAHRLIGQTPVVLITAFGDPRTHERALLRGATVVLDKPVRMALLCETVASLLARDQTGRSVAATAL